MGKRRIHFHIPAYAFGIIAAALAVIAQLYFALRPPQAYGICIVCHGRDLVNTLLTAWTSYSAPVSDAALKGLLVTPIGILLGAFIVAVINGEFKLRFSEIPLVSMICGFVVMSAGLVISGCPMRLLLRAGYGDIAALGYAVVLVFGVLFGTVILKAIMRKRQ